MIYFCSDQDYKNRKAIKLSYCDAAVIKKVFGGWYVFETYADYETWLLQK